MWKPVGDSTIAFVRVFLDCFNARQKPYLPNAPYVLIIRRESNDVFITCRDENRFCTTGILRYANKRPRNTSIIQRIRRPSK